MASDDQPFKNRTEARAWLLAQGCKVSVGSFYQDGKAGKYAVREDGTVSRAAMAEYLLRRQRKARVPDLDLVDYSQERQQLEVKKLRLEVGKRELDNRREDNRWLRKEDAWAAVAGVLVHLKDSLHHQFHEGATLLIHLAGGDPVRAPEVLDACLDLCGQAFNELAGARIEGVFAEPQEGEGAADE